MARREQPARAHVPKQTPDTRGTRGPQAQAGRSLGAAAQLAAVHRTLRHGPAVQLQAGGAAAGGQPAGASRAAAANRTGLPDRLKRGIEALSGVALDGVKVHYNSAKPKQLKALAYTQGSEIHLAPGQERHLPHEAWHVVQQAQGRVRATAQLKTGLSLNDDAGLEREADVMGARAAAVQYGSAAPSSPPGLEFVPASQAMPVQRMTEPAELEVMPEKEVVELITNMPYAELRLLAEAIIRGGPTQKQAEPATSTKAETEPKEVKPKEIDLKPTEPEKSAQKPATKRPGHKYLGLVIKMRDAVDKEIDEFAEQNGYVVGKSLDVNPLFGNLARTLYPLEGKHPQKDKKQSDRVHRPILEIEIVGNKPFARSYLGLYAPAKEDTHKDITADETGKITLKDVGLMNLGNPMKALLWCEDYLSNEEHFTNKMAKEKTKPPPRPVVRSFLVPLANASGLLRGEGEFGKRTRPLDQDRGSGQFGNKGEKNVYAELLQPLIGSLVSFFHDPEDFKSASDKGQRKLGLVNLQEHLTGQRADPRAMVLGEKGEKAKKGGMAAQHGRNKYEAEFAKEYEDVLTAYYDSVDALNSLFLPMEGKGTGHRGSHDIPEAFDEFPLVKGEIGKLPQSTLDSSASKSKEIGPQQLPVGVQRLRAFVQAYRALPVTPVGPQQAPQNEQPSSKKPEAPSTKDKAEPPSSKDKPEPPSTKDKSEAPNVSNQYARAENAKVLPSEWFKRRHNAGGGDCLYFALEGKNLDLQEVLDLRAQVARIREVKPDSDLQSAYNANIVAATITQTPALAPLVPDVRGRQAVSNALLATMQSIPTVYAGPEELIQWCFLKNRTAYVIDHDGTITDYSGGGAGRQVIYNGTSGHRDAIRTIVQQHRLVLYKSAGHWERIDGVTDQFGK